MGVNTLGLALAVGLTTAVLVFVFRHPRVSGMLCTQIPEHPKRRLFLASVGFFIAFAIARTVAYANSHQLGPFHDLYIGGRHVHHLVFGIALLLAVGYGWLVRIGEPGGPAPRLWSVVMSLWYGVGAALTLDEFALWLNLEDVYWAREGRESIDAIILFGALLLMGLLGRRFFTAVMRSVLRLT